MFLGKEAAHCWQVAVKGWPIIAIGLHEEGKEQPAGFEPAVKAPFVVAALDGINGAEAGLLVDGIEGLIGCECEQIVVDQMRM